MILEKLKENFLAEILETCDSHGDPAAVVRKDRLREVLVFLKEDPAFQFDQLLDLCGVDRSRLGEAIRFEVVYHFYSLTHHHRLRLRVKVPQEDPRVATATDFWQGADWFERECWEMFGIVFEGHPRLKHLLLFDGFEGYPLRKDYPIAKRQKIPVSEEVV